LTRDQRDAWQSFGSEWDAFRKAWQKRGPSFGFPPSGDVDTADSQRAVLWPIVVDWPDDAARWVAEAPPGSPFEVVGYVLDQHDASREIGRASADRDEREAQAMKAADKAASAPRLAVIAGGGRR
jgi:hypothetical protein